MLIVGAEQFDIWTVYSFIENLIEPKEDDDFFFLFFLFFFFPEFGLILKDGPNSFFQQHVRNNEN
jgi:hypothetical protein